jgi:hypothetical protein
MTRPPIVRITAALVGLGVLAIAVFAAFYIVGALAAVVVCAALGVGLIALVAWSSTKLTHYRDRKNVGGPLEPAHPPAADPPG